MLSSLRNFILALFFSLVVFGIGAYFLVGFVTGFLAFIDPSQEDTTVQNPDDYNNGDDIRSKASSSHLTVLIVGIDNGESQLNEKREADLIYLININSETQKFLISPIPCETRVNVKNYIFRLGMVMAEYGIDTLVDTVKAYTGVTPDYYCVLEYENIIDMMELFGEVVFDVPMDMFYMPEPYPPIEIDEESEEEIEEQEPEIDLKQGKQPIDGEQMIQLFRYKDYSNGNLGRIDTQIEFIKEFIRQKITFEYLRNAKEIYNALKESVSTNMKEQDFNKYMDLVFSISSPSYEFVLVEYPGHMSLEFGGLYYNPSTTTALRRYKEAGYRKMPWMP